MSNVITYKQINFKRTYDCTNIKFIQVSDNEHLDSKIWELCDADEIDCDLLWKEGNRRLYGYL